MRVSLNKYSLNFNNKISSAKIELLLEVLDQIGNEKVVVFCYYVKMLEIIPRINS